MLTCTLETKPYPTFWACTDKVSLQYDPHQQLRSEAKSALEICQDLEQKGQLAVFSKDTAWLYKTAYNLGIEGISMWDDTYLIIECFSVAISVSTRCGIEPGLIIRAVDEGLSKAPRCFGGPYHAEADGSRHTCDSMWEW